MLTESDIETVRGIATDGGDDVDLIGLASVLLLRAANEHDAGRPAGSTTLQAEAIRLLDKAADSGSETAAQMLSLAGEMCTREAWAEARRNSRAAFLPSDPNEDVR